MTDYEKLSKELQDEGLWQMLNNNKDETSDLLFRAALAIAELLKKEETK